MKRSKWRENARDHFCEENWHESSFRFRLGFFCHGFHKLLPWRSQTFAVAFTKFNFCRGFHKLLPWFSQTFAVAFTNFCCGFHKLLPWRSHTFAVAFTNFCHGVHKLLPWRSQTFAVLTRSLFSWCKNKVACIPKLN